MAKLKCKNVECGGTYFEKVKINEFHDYGGSLYGSLPEVDIDNDIKAYRCIACKQIAFPTLDYTNSQTDRDLLSDLTRMVNGEKVEQKPNLPKSRRVAPGTMRALDEEERDPSQAGRIMRTQMNLELLHPADGQFDFKKIQGIPNKHGEFSGYLLIAMVRSYLSVGSGKTTVDRYVCFTDETYNQVWIEKLTIFRPRRWFAFEDTIKIEDEEEFNELLDFLKEKEILDPKSQDDKERAG